MKKLLSLLTAAVMLFVVCAAAISAEEVPEPTRDAVGMNLSSMHTTDFYNNPVDGSVFSQTTLTVLNVWATWCGPCLGEMPDFKLLNEYYSSTSQADVQIIGVLYDDYGDDLPEAIQIVESNGYDWLQLKMCPLLYNAADSLGEYIGLPVPQTLIIDSSGVVRMHKQGRFWDYEEMYEYVSY